MEYFEKLSTEFISSQNLSSKITGAIVGGSFARRESTSNSDIDLMIVVKDKYKNLYSQIHSSSKKFKGRNFSIIYQSEKSLKNYLKNPDPSIISFLRDGIIIADTENKLLKIKRESLKIKIYKSQKDMAESKRRLKERLKENTQKIDEKIKLGDLVSGTYLLRNITDEIVEKMRMYEEDWLYTQKKSNLKFLEQKRYDSFKKLFLKINTPLTKAQLVKYVKSLENLINKN